jgi:hypothetical protein
MKGLRKVCLPVQFVEANFDDVVETCDDVTTVRPHGTLFIAKIIEFGNEADGART